MAVATPQQYSKELIKTQVHITKDQVVVDGKILVKDDGIIRATYNHLDMKYPKFFKMDRLCKLGVLGSEIVVSKNAIECFEDDEIALVFNNRDSSLESDVKHQSSLEEGAPSPAVFVYTLPNIVLGEIGIRQKWYGEQLFTVSDSPDAKQLTALVNNLFELKKAKACLLGIVNSLSDDFDAKFVWIEKDENGAGIPLTALNLKQIIT